MRNARLLVCTATAVAMMATAAQAQSERKFNATLTMRTVYDDHVSRSANGIAAVRGLSQEDVSFSPTLALDIVRPMGRNSIFLAGAIAYNFYEKNDQLNSENISLNGGVNGSLASCRGGLSGGLDRRQSELDDLSLTVVENIETTTSVRFSANCGRASGIQPTFGVTQEWSDNSSSQRAEADYETLSGTVGLSYGRPTLGVLNIFASAARTEYDIPTQTLIGPQDNGYETYGGGVRFSRQLGARIQGSVNAGYSVVQPNSPTLDDFEGFTYGGDISYRVSSRLSGSVNFSRAVSPSSRVKSSYSVSETYGINAAYRIGSRLRVSAGGSYAENTFEGLAGAVTLTPTRETVKAVFGAISYDLGRRISISLDANQQERDANVHGFDYTANRYGLSIIAKY